MSIKANEKHKPLWERIVVACTAMAIMCAVAGLTTLVVNAELKKLPPCTIEVA